MFMFSALDQMISRGLLFCAFFIICSAAKNRARDFPFYCYVSSYVHVVLILITCFTWSFVDVLGSGALANNILLCPFGILIRCVHRSRPMAKYLKPFVFRSHLLMNHNIPRDISLPELSNDSRHLLNHQHLVGAHICTVESLLLMLNASLILRPRRCPLLHCRFTAFHAECEPNSPTS